MGGRERRDAYGLWEEERGVMLTACGRKRGRDAYSLWEEESGVMLTEIPFMNKCTQTGLIPRLSPAFLYDRLFCKNDI